MSLSFLTYSGPLTCLMLTCGHPSLESLTFLWTAPHLADMRVDLSDIVSLSLSLSWVNWALELSYDTFLKARRENKVHDKVSASSRLENGLVVPASFLARTTSQAIAAKFEINRLKELCIHIDIIIKKRKSGITYVSNLGRWTSFDTYSDGAVTF